MMTQRKLVFKAWTRHRLRFVRTWRFDALVDVLIVLNAVLLFDSIGTSGGGAVVENDGRAQRIEEAFVVLYLAELVLKLLAFGPKRFFRSKINCIDALITLATTGLEIATGFGYSTRRTLRVALVLRLLRLLRVLVALRRFNRIFAIFVSLLPAFGTMFGMLWVIFNFFAEVRAIAAAFDMLCTLVLVLMLVLLMLLSTKQRWLTMTTATPLLSLRRAELSAGRNWPIRWRNIHRTAEAQRYRLQR